MFLGTKNTVQQLPKASPLWKGGSLMSDELQSLFEKAMLNNSYDYEAMHTALKKTWTSSYSYLHNLQNGYVKYEEFHYVSDDVTCRDNDHIGHLYLDKSERVRFKFKYDLIHGCNREEYRLSQYYQNEISFLEMVDHPEIFDLIPIVIIDNHVVYDYSIELVQGVTEVKLPFKRNFIIENRRNTETDKVVYITHSVQVILIENIKYCNMEVNNSIIHLDQGNHTITLPKEDIPDLNNDGIFMASFTVDSDIIPQLGTMITALEENEDGDFVSYLSEDVFMKLASVGVNYTMHLMFFNELRHKKFYTDSYTASGKTLFLLEKAPDKPYAMPIPIEDFMVFEEGPSDTGFHLVSNQVLSSHYPNIYTMDCDDVINHQIFYFYHPDESITYSSILDFYYTFICNKFKMNVEEVFAKLYDGTFADDSCTEDQMTRLHETFEKILSYNDDVYHYGEIDFLNRFMLEEDNDGKTPWEYQDVTLKEWISRNPDTLRKYVLDQKTGMGQCLHLFTNTLDLESRKRLDTSIEMGMPDGTPFNEPMYVFAFNNTKDGLRQLDIRVFVDGEFIENAIQERNAFLEYLYIPASRVTSDSYIEIEIFPGYAFDVNLTFDSLEDEKTVTIMEPTDNIYPTVADVYLNETAYPNNLYDSAFFDFTTVTKNGEYEVRTVDEERPVVFTRLKTFKIKPNDEAVLNKEFKLKISKCPRGVLYKIEKDSYPYISLVENLFKFNVKYLRIFHNGRFVPSTKYMFYTSYDSPRIQFLEEYKKGDILYIDITPFRYEEVYRLEELTEGGLVDLAGHINKPFDNRYYDVYVNGRRMSFNNIIRITDYKIAFVNLTSLYNLQIFEKDRDWEYFGLDSESLTYYFSIDDLFNENYVTKEDKEELLKTIIDARKDPHLTINPNTNDEEKIDFDDNRKYVWFPIFYYNELIPKTFVNPDILQFSKTHIEDEYTLIYDEYHRSPITDSNDSIEIARRLKYPKALALDPDTIIEGKKRENEATPMYVYTVGHLEDVESELLDQSIDVNDTPKYE